MIWRQSETKLFLRELSSIMSKNRAQLILLDSIMGDGDLGITMSSGFSAAYEAIKNMDQPDIGKLLYQAGKAMGRAVPSSMGTLMASGLMNAGKAVVGKIELTFNGILTMMQGWEYGVEKLGKARLGEKTFLDGFIPGIMALSNGEDLLQTYQKAMFEAQKGAENTVGMIAVHGRAAIRGEESKEIKDPGAVVASLIFEALYETCKLLS